MTVSPATPGQPTVGFGKAGTTFTIDLEATEPLAQPPTVTLGLASPVVLGCDIADIGRNMYSCTYAASGAEGGPGAGKWVTVPFTVSVMNRARVQNARTAGVLTMRVAPPVAMGSSVDYVPAPANLLRTVARATTGTTIRVKVIADESLACVTIKAGEHLPADWVAAGVVPCDGQGVPQSAVPALVAHSGATSLPFTRVAGTIADPGSLDMNGVTFEAVVNGQADGDYIATLTWTDLAGNSGTVDLQKPIQIKTSPPTLTVDQSKVTFVRSPIGNSQPESLGAYTIPAGSYFALEPSDPLSSSARVPAGAFVLDGSVVPTQVVVKSGAGSGALMLGVLASDAGGTFPRQALSSPDLAAVWVAGVDDAGNPSPAVKIANVEWVATSSSPASGTSPHALSTVGFPSASRVQSLDVDDVTGAIGASAADNNAVLAKALAAWKQAGGSWPSARNDNAFAYDSARGRVVMFGGYLTNGPGVFFQDTWEWDGTAWLNKTPSPLPASWPSARHSTALTYDAARGRVVMFGGYSNLQDLWEWDGTAWTNLTPSPLPANWPPARSGHALAYDSARKRVVLFGGYYGLRDTWEWDGNSWTNLTPTTLTSTNSPSARYMHGLAYDCARGRVVLFGGTNASSGMQDTWEWDGSAWANKTPSPLPSSWPGTRGGEALVYDTVRGRVVLFGGNAAGFGGADLQDVWEWDGSNWSTRTPSPLPASWPSARSRFAAAYDTGRGRMVLFGGMTGNTGRQDAWEWDGSAGTWTNKTALSAGWPPARSETAMVNDSVRGRVVLFGGWSSGALADTWEWDGVTWNNRTPASSPSARSGHAMAFDSGRGRVVLFGGSSGNQETWEWDGSAWYNRTPSPLPTSWPIGRVGHAMAYDSARGRVVLFGGASTQGEMQDTWEWDGNAWTNRTPSPVPTNWPTGQRFHALAYDTTRNRTVLFGGMWATPTSPQGPSHDLWEWDGSLWTNRTPATLPASWPSGRDEHSLAYDTARGRMILFGGASQQGLERDTWEWDGTIWSNATPAVLPPAWPTARRWYGLAYDSARGQTVLFGGGSAQGDQQDTWFWDASPSRTSAVQFDASSLGAGFDASSITGITVRAYSGAVFYPGDSSAVGATLLGWTSFGQHGEPGAWLALAANATPLSWTAPYLPAGLGALMVYKSSTPQEAQRLVTQRDGQASFEVRPSGTAGPVIDGTGVALDYIEVRVRYAAPP